MTRRILFLYSSLAIGGAERQLTLLAPELRRLGFEPLVGVLRVTGDFVDELRRAGVPVAHARMQSRSDLRGVLRAYRYWRTRPDLVFTQSIDAHVIGHAIARRARVPHIAAEHRGPGIRRGAHRRLAARLVAPHVTRVVAVSSSQIADLRALGYPDERVRVIPNGLPPLTTTRERSEVRRELGLGDDDVAAILVAVLRPEKRADRFVDAVRRAHSVDPRIRGLVVGGGPQLDEIRARAGSSGGPLVVLGERPDAAELVAASDLVCVTSDVEGLPMSVLEAMALSRPIVATDVGGLRDAIVPGRTGVLVPATEPAMFADALVELARAPELRAAMGEEAHRLFLERYTLERMADAYASLFACVIR